MLLLPLLFLLVVSASSNPLDNLIDDCEITPELRAEIASYAPKVLEIIKETSSAGNFNGFTYSQLSEFVDKFGSRFTGTENLENAIDYMLNRSRQEQLDNVHGEEVQVPRWIRGEESAVLLEPLHKKLAILGLGYSVGTPEDGITAPVLVVRSFDELHARRTEVAGKIVVYNQDFVSYGVSVKFRVLGASEASKLGAVASLIRSVTPFSLNTPHTGMQRYLPNVTAIPTACITVEDARLLQRLQDRQENVTIQLKMQAKTLEPVQSRNTVVELTGSTQPEKYVLVSGHLDSWDVGNGAMDDGGGAFISWSSLVLLKRLNLRPKRTIRAVLWTGEEMGLLGASAYQKTHQNDFHNLIFSMESDEGTFTPLGLQYSAGPKGECILKEIVKLLEPINATQAVKSKTKGVGSDISIWTSQGLPGASLLNQNERYLWYHHTDADTLDVENSGDLDKGTALWASVAYILADLSVDFPQELQKKTGGL